MANVRWQAVRPGSITPVVDDMHVTPSPVLSTRSSDPFDPHLTPRLTQGEMADDTPTCIRELALTRVAERELVFCVRIRIIAVTALRRTGGRGLRASIDLWLVKTVGVKQLRDRENDRQG
jgi:hypothetical protein